jgi:hypothetical protein
MIDPSWHLITQPQGHRMTVSHSSRARSARAVTRSSAPAVNTPAVCLALPVVSQPCFRDRRQRIIVGAPAPEACPFCARRDALVIVTGLTVMDAPPHYHVTCDSCGADGPEGPSRRAAGVLWNKLGVIREHRLQRLLCGPGEP